MATRKINIKELARDIRLGMTDPDLREKYRLSSNGLRTAFKKLLHAKAVKHSELYETSRTYREEVAYIRARSAPRAEIVDTIPVHIYDIDSSRKGFVRDISETGLRVAGISAVAGQTKTFLLSLDMFTQADPILVRAKCRWTKTRGKNLKYLVAGFEITNISDSALSELRMFIRSLTLSKSGEWATMG